MESPAEKISARRQVRGLSAHLSGAAAEETVARHYESAGWTILERRWHGEGGEIDLIAVRDGVTAFVEVKQSATIDAAIASLQPRQLERIAASAEGYFLNEQNSSSTEMRVDLAAIDKNSCIEIIENVTLW